MSQPNKHDLKARLVSLRDSLARKQRYSELHSQADRGRELLTSTKIPQAKRESIGRAVQEFERSKNLLTRAGMTQTSTKDLKAAISDTTSQIKTTKTFAEQVKHLKRLKSERFHPDTNVIKSDLSKSDLSKIVLLHHDKPEFAWHNKLVDHGDVAQGRAHGWISPIGNYYHMNPNEAHEEWLRSPSNEVHLKDHYDNEPKAYGAGWLSIGHGGAHNVQGAKGVLSDASHPATKTARRLAMENFGHRTQLVYVDAGKEGHGRPWKARHTGSMEYDDVNTHQWAKHGVITRPGSIADIRSNPLYKTQKFYSPEEVIEHHNTHDGTGDPDWLEEIAEHIRSHPKWEKRELIPSLHVNLKGGMPNPEVVSEYAAMSSKAPAIIAVPGHNGRHDILDGMHRATAAHKRKRPIEAFVPAGQTGLKKCDPNRIRDLLRKGIGKGRVVSENRWLGRHTTSAAYASNKVERRIAEADYGEKIRQQLGDKGHADITLYRGISRGGGYKGKKGGKILPTALSHDVRYFTPDRGQAEGIAHWKSGKMSGEVRQYGVRLKNPRIVETRHDEERLWDDVGKHIAEKHGYRYDKPFPSRSGGLIRANNPDYDAHPHKENFRGKGKGIHWNRDTGYPAGHSKKRWASPKQFLGEYLRDKGHDAAVFVSKKVPGVIKRVDGKEIHHDEIHTNTDRMSQILIPHGNHLPIRKSDNPLLMKIEDLLWKRSGNVKREINRVRSLPVDQREHATATRMAQLATKMGYGISTNVPAPKEFGGQAEWKGGRSLSSEGGQKRIQVTKRGPMTGMPQHFQIAHELGHASMTPMGSSLSDYNRKMSDTSPRDPVKRATVPKADQEWSIGEEYKAQAAEAPLSRRAGTHPVTHRFGSNRSGPVRLAGHAEARERIKQLESGWEIHPEHGFREKPGVQAKIARTQYHMERAKQKRPAEPEVKSFPGRPGGKSDIPEAFLTGKAAGSPGGLYTTGDKPARGHRPHTIYSFGSHWPLAARREGGLVVANQEQYGGLSTAPHEKIAQLVHDENTIHVKGPHLVHAPLKQIHAHLGEQIAQRKNELKTAPGQLSLGEDQHLAGLRRQQKRVESVMTGKTVRHVNLKRTLSNIGAKQAERSAERDKRFAAKQAKVEAQRKQGKLF